MTLLLLHRFLGKDIDTASNIVFANGDLDPWSGGGVLEVYNFRSTASNGTCLAHHRPKTTTKDQKLMVHQYAVM